MKLGNSKGVKTGVWFPNEMLHADDINFVGEGTYQNATDLLAILAEQGVATGTTKDIVLSGLLLEWNNLLTSDLRAGMAISYSGYYLTSDGTWGFQASAGDIFSVVTGADQSVAVVAGGAQDRYDTIEVRPIQTKYDAKSRAFKDPVTGLVTSASIETKIEYGYEFQVLEGTEGGSPVAPTHTAGWIKIAEVHVIASATDIVQSDIKDVRDSDSWTTEADHTKYKEPFVGEKVTSTPTGGTATSLDKEDTIKAALDEIFTRLRNLSGVQNDAVDSRHYAADSIDDEHVNWGDGASEVDADLMPLGTIITHAPTGGTAAGLTASSMVRFAVQKILDLLIDLSGVQNAAVLSRHINADQLDSEHYIADSIDNEHVNWGTGSGQIGLLKGHLAIVLTDYTGTGQPQIAGSGSCEINGGLYTNPSAVSITGATSNSTWYDILLTPSGSTYTASFVARNTGVWSDSKQGLYSGNNRVVACVYKDGSGDFINKNMLEVKNRTVQIKMQIGIWNMDLSVSATIAHGLSFLKVRSVCALIVDNGSVALTPISVAPNADGGHTNGTVYSVNSTSIRLERLASGYFDDPSWDDGAMNRGWLTVGYEV